MFDLLNLIHSIPFFRHLSREEIIFLKNNSNLIEVKRAQTFNLKKNNSFNIIVSGIFEIETPGKSQVIYLSPGSFFGNIPLSLNKNTGIVRSVKESSLLVIPEQTFFKLFFSSYKAVRGFVNLVNRTGFPISKLGREYLDTQSKVITIFSNEAKIGKTFLSSLIASYISTEDTVLLIDSSFIGESIFDFWGKLIMPPLSQKGEGDNSKEDFLTSRIDKSDDSVHFLNLSHNSKVKVDSSIVSVILFILSKKYKYIVFDLSNDDLDLRDAVFSNSDIIYSIFIDKKSLNFLHKIFDEKLSSFQRVYYVLNRHFSRGTVIFNGGFILNAFNELKEKQKLYDFQFLIKKISDNVKELELFLPIKKKLKSLVMQGNLLESVYYAGFFNAMEEQNLSYDFFYASSYSFLVLALYMLSENIDEFNKNIQSLFREERLNYFLDMNFPEKFVFKNNNFFSFAKNLSKGRRIENFNAKIAVKLFEEGTSTSKIFSTGDFSTLLTAAFSLTPLFQGISLNEKIYSAGYPYLVSPPGDIFRSDIDEITSLSIKSGNKFSFKHDRILPFFIDFLDKNNLSINKDIDVELADNRIIYDRFEKYFQVSKIIETSTNFYKNIMKI